MAAKSKAKKRKLPADLSEAENLLRSANSAATSISDAHKALQRVDLSEVQGLPTTQQCSEDEIATWLVARYGVNEVQRLCTASSELPNTLTPFQRLRYFRQFTGRRDDASFLCDLLDKFPTLVTVFSTRSTASPRILAPPAKQCALCCTNLVENHKCQVKVYTTSGVMQAEKVTLRCLKCSTTYNYSTWGNKREKGFIFYEGGRELIEVNDAVYYERKLLELQCSLA